MPGAGARSATANYADVDRYVEGGLAYCAEHDLEIYERYLYTYRARAALDRARWDEAIEAAMVVVHERGPSIIPPQVGSRRGGGWPG